jgi:restriction system protein
MKWLEIGHKKIKNELSTELLIRVKETSPKFFENLVIELLIKMGYGGSLEERGSVTLENLEMKELMV